MIVPRDVLVRHGIVDSPRVCALPVTVQLFFRNILHVCDGAGRFPADADELRRALYGRAPGVQRSHVEAWLQKTHQAGLVKLYTRGAQGYGEVLNFGQRDTKRKVLYPGHDDDELNFAPTFGPDEVKPPRKPRAKPIKEINRSEEKGGDARREAPPPPPPESYEAWIDRLRAAWPHIDLDAEIAAAITKKAKEGRKLERRWFERSWLPNASPLVTRAETIKRPPAVTFAEPAGWREALDGTNYGPGAIWEVTSWAEVCAKPDLLNHVMQRLDT